MKLPFEKWVTLAFDKDDMQKTTIKDDDKVSQMLADEVDNILRDMREGIPATLKITNQPKRTY